MQDVEPIKPALTRVNGIGQWNAWTRNFNSPLLALLDLFDNSVDAAMKPAKKKQAHNDDSDMLANGGDDNGGFRGKIKVEADCLNRSRLSGDDNDGSDEDYEDIDDAPQEKITGIVITNNSYRPIKNLEKILEAYSSAKGREEHGEDHHEGEFAETIGENGVGLKQGCAVLSDLSFVLVRQGDGEASKFSLGFIARQLQRPEGISLPSIEFVSDNLDSLREEMLSLFTEKTAVGMCVASYGIESIGAGINRLLWHFHQMSSKTIGGWGHSSDVFRIVLNDVKGSAESNLNALSLMDEIESSLPSTYIHIPENLEVSVNGRAINFNYYQSRLIELTAFYHKIDATTPVGGDNEWKNPGHGYSIRMLFGFDASRKGAGRPRLCIHSRHSGRLVKSEDDCRAILGLTTGSSDFCQGLTIVVDDMFAYLPLTPTKQDIAFGEQGDAGNVHKTNLFSWIGAYTYLFYSIQKNKFGGSKKNLSRAVSQQHSQQNASTWNGPPLDNCEFTQYAGIEWKYIKATGNIRCANFNKVSLSVEGRDTRWKLNVLPEIAHATNAGTSSSSSHRSSPRPKKKRNIEQIHSPSDDDGAPVHDLMLPGSSLQAAVRIGLARERSPNTRTISISTGEVSTPRAEPPGSDYKKLYEELKKEHEGLKEKHQNLIAKYQKKRDYKEMAKILNEKSEQLKNELKIERVRREEEVEEKEEDVREKDAIIKRLEKKNVRLEERIKALDSVYSPQMNGR